MVLLDPPSARTVEGWTFTGFRVGHRARVTVTDHVMRVDFAAYEAGPESGVAAIIDPGVAAMTYNVYFPTPATARAVKLPGAAGPVPAGAAAGLRAPGWNSVTVGAARVTLNGSIDAGPSAPHDLGCYVAAAAATTGIGPSDHVYLNSFDVTPEVVAEQPAVASSTAAAAARFRFAA